MYRYKYIRICKYVSIGTYVYDKCILCIYVCMSMHRYVYIDFLLKITQSYYRNKNNRQAREKIKITCGSAVHS